MISTIVLATKNQHKKREIQYFLNPLSIQVITVDELQIDLPDSVEQFSTYQENAKAKCDYISQFTNHPILADDSGLEISILQGMPGVMSARYGGTGKDSDNRKKILEELAFYPETERKARFVCVLCLFYDKKYYYFTGESSGKILSKEAGDKAFGYDCLFFCDIFKKSYGQLTFEEKMSVCHRGNAMKKLQEWIQKIPKVGLEPTKGCPH
jgi:XTP/dITP diphosphohydrolase